ETRREAPVLRNISSDSAWVVDFCSRASQRILMVQATEYCLRMNGTKVVEPMPKRRQRHGQTRGRIRNAWSQRCVRTSAVVMRHPSFERLTQMRFRQRNYPVQTLSSNRPNDAFADGIRFWTSRWALQYAQPQPPDGLIHLGREDAVAIVQQVFVSLLVSHCLAQLLPPPLRGRMRGHVEVDQSTAVMLDDDEHVQDSECARHRDTEITSDDGSCVLAQEGRPSLISARPSWRGSRHVLGHRTR